MMDEAQKRQIRQDNEAITMAWNDVDRVYRRLAAASGYSESVLWILYVLWITKEPLRSSQITKCINLPKQTLSSALCQLRRQGLVLQESPRDPVSLSPAGLQACRQTIAPVEALEGNVLQAMGPERSGQLASLMEEYARLFVQLEETARSLPAPVRAPSADSASQITREKPRG